MASKKPFVLSDSSKDKTVEFGKNKDKLLIDVAKNDLEFFQQIENLYYSKYNPTKQKYYNSLKRRFVENQGLYNQENLLDKVSEAVSLMKQRQSSNQISKHLSTQYNLKREVVERIMSDANTLIRKEFEQEKSLLLDLHLLRYEEIFLENLNLNVDEIPAGYRKAMKCESLITAMDTLFQKERLLGVHTKTFKLRANSSVLERKDTEFDMTILSKGERLEVFELLSKAKSIEEYKQPAFSTSSNPLNIDIRTNKVESDKIEAPIKGAKQTDIMGDNELAGKVAAGKSLEEVKEVMGNTLKDKVKELFEKKKKNL